ncbi:MAG: hypothetical protein ACETWE_05680 [Candidatus Bathyarchaeia archaeon]
MTFQEQIENCRNYGDVFGVVKRAVKETTGRERVGLMLYLGNLPLRVGAFHGLGSNGIVINRRLIELMSKSARSTTEMNSFTFTLLLHEYLHSLGYVEERQVRRLTLEISEEVFGRDHSATMMALQLPMPRIPPSEMQLRTRDLELELVKDFERSNQSYIS